MVHPLRTRPPVRATLTVIGLLLLLGSGLPQRALAVDSHEARTEQRIQSMHTRLAITPAQETLWTPVVEAMREDAQRMDALTQSRREHAGEMSALEDLKSYGEVTDAHAQGIHKLAEVFAPLYAAMSAGQKQDADKLFRAGGRDMAHHRAAGKASGS